MNKNEYWIEVTPEMREKLKKAGRELDPEIIRLPRLNFDIGMPGSLNYRIARGQASPDDYQPKHKKTEQK